MVYFKKQVDTHENGFLKSIDDLTASNKRPFSGVTSFDNTEERDLKAFEKQCKELDMTSKEGMGILSRENML